MLVCSSAFVLHHFGDEASAVTESYHDGGLQVNLTLENGTAAAYHIVLVKNENRYYPYISSMAYTNETGAAEMRLPPSMWGNCTVYAANESGWYVSSERFLAEPDKDVFIDIQLGPAAPETNTISGTVRNLTDGSPLPGASVTIVGTDRMQNGVWKQMITGMDGRYSLTFPDMASFQVQAQSLYHHLRYWDVNTYPGKTDYTYDTYLAPLPTSLDQMHLRFVDSAAATPLNGTLDISGRSLRSGHEWEGVFWLTPNSTGWFEADLGAGEYTANIDVENGDNSSARFSVHLNYNGTGAPVEVPVSPIPLDRIRVTAMDGTAPIPSAFVSYYTEGRNWMESYTGHGSTDGSGSLFISVLSDRATELYLSADGYETASVEYDPMTSPAELTVQMEKDTTVSEVAKVRILPTDQRTGLRLFGEVIFEWEDGMTLTMMTNNTGVLDAEVPPGVYSKITARTGLGIGHVDGIVLSEGSNADIAVPVERSFQGTTYPPVYTLRIVDEEGDPVAGAEFIVTSEEPLGFAASATDATGTFTFPSEAASVVVRDGYSDITSPARWSIPQTSIELDGSGGHLGDITAYQCRPLTEVSGFVRDKETNEPIGGASVYTMSYRSATGGSTISDGDPQLFSMEHGSDPSGFYRIWGRDLVEISVNDEDHFPYYEVVEVGTSPALGHDILLEQIPERTVHVNGTITDQDGTPVAGTVLAIDTEHMAVIDSAETMTGEFALMLYEGDFTLNYMNETLSGSYDLAVTGDVEGIVLRLVPLSEVEVALISWNGTELADMTVQVFMRSGDDLVLNASGTTGPDGMASFELERGTYRVRVPAQKGYEMVESDDMVLTGWNRVDLTYTLGNLTKGTLSGLVNANGGPFEGGIPGVTVTLSQGNASLSNVTTDASGSYVMEDVPFGRYNITFEPPSAYAYQEGARSGYRPFTGNVTVEQAEVGYGIAMRFDRVLKPGYLNLTQTSPTGTGVSTEAPIVLTFSHAVDTDLFEEYMVSVVPVPANLTYSFLGGDTVLRIGHDAFEANTTYFVSVLPLFYSAEGYPMWETGMIRWNFTTGDSAPSWELYSFVVSSAADKTTTFAIVGRVGISVFVVVDGIGSYAGTEIASGTYTASIPGGDLEYDTTYAFHFSNASGGSDMAPSLGGTFTTPEAPPVTWSISSATVKVDKDRNWEVTVLGGEGQQVYIVIDGIGSFLLTESSPGRYTTTIDGSNFEWEEEYDYHFSPTDGGEAPAGFEIYSGSVKTGSEPIKATNWGVIMGVTCLVLLFLMILLAVILFFVLRKRDDSEAWED